MGKLIRLSTQKTILLISLVGVLSLVVILTINGYSCSSFIDKLYSFFIWDMRAQLVWSICIVIGVFHYIGVSQYDPTFKSLLLQTSYGFINSMLNVLTCAAIINSTCHILGELITSNRANIIFFTATLDYVTLLTTLGAGVIFSFIVIYKMLEQMFTYEIKGEKPHNVTGTGNESNK